MNRYILGNPVKVSVVFAVNGVATDPSSVKLIVRVGYDPAIEYVYGDDLEVVKDSTGNFSMHLPADQPGLWNYRWEGTGAVKAAFQGQFIVQKSNTGETIELP